jgi:predicted ATP-grasp superfamily ATP-dependent carboligase
LIQRDEDGQWVQGVPVVRQSRTDPVANASRGAQVAPGTTALEPSVLEKITHHMNTICRAIDQIEGYQWALEAGVDLVLDTNHTPWLIEVNSRPRGRMEVLASQNPTLFSTAHLNACCRPIQRIVRLIEQES